MNHTQYARLHGTSLKSHLIYNALILSSAIPFLSLNFPIRLVQSLWITSQCEEKKAPFKSTCGTKVMLMSSCKLSMCYCSTCLAVEILNFMEKKKHYRAHEYLANTYRHGNEVKRNVYNAYILKFLKITSWELAMTLSVLHLEYWIMAWKSINQRALYVSLSLSITKICIKYWWILLKYHF